MPEERATATHEFWSYRFGLLPTDGQKYLNWRHRACKPHVAGKAILDVPSGEGVGLKHFRGAKTITCLDYDQTAVARALSTSSNVVEAVCADMTAMPFDAWRFDVVVSLEGLEHLDKGDGVRFLAEAWRVLRDGGELLLSCPLCVNGRHSGNQYHLHEWQQADLDRTLSIGFEIVESRIHRWAVPVLWCRARKKRCVSGADEFISKYQADAGALLDERISSLQVWISSQLSSAGAPMCVGGTKMLLPTCFAILAGECAGVAVRERNDRQAIQDFILEHQDEETGLFSPGELKRAELPTRSATYLRLQATYFAIHAVDALGASLRSPIRFAESLCDVSYLRGWLDGGPWQNPWLHSNNVMFALTLLVHQYREAADLKAIRAFDAVLDYLDNRQDPITGLWQPDDEPDVPNAVFAAYHFFPYYFWRGRKPQHVDRIIDSTLSIQQHDGLFASGGGACEDLDAVHTLVMMSLVTDYRNQEVRRSLARCFWRLLQLQNSDGGFPNGVAESPRLSSRRRMIERLGLGRFLPERYRQRGIRPPRKWAYSGWKPMSCPIGQSDIWAGWFRLLAIRLIAERFNDLPQSDVFGRYRRLPGLGWHDAEMICSCLQTNDTELKAPLAESSVGRREE